MAALPSRFLLLAGALLVAGCGVVGEERMAYMQRDWDRLKGPVWSESAETVGFDELSLTAKQKEAANEKAICGHPNSQNRVVTQDGVNDSFGYKRCPLAPYDMKGGTRMGNRPDGVGKVVK